MWTIKAIDEFEYFRAGRGFWARPDMEKKEKNGYIFYNMVLT